MPALSEYANVIDLHLQELRSAMPPETVAAFDAHIAASKDEMDAFRDSEERRGARFTEVREAYASSLEEAFSHVLNLSEADWKPVTS